MDWEEISNISTTIGVVVSTLTLISGYRLYKLSKEDEYLKKIRNVLISFKFNCNDLNQTLTYEIVHELVYNVVYSIPVKSELLKIYGKYFTGKTNKESIEDYLDKNFKSITVPIHTQLLKDFGISIKLNSDLSSEVYTDFPALYRVFEVSNYIFISTIEISKQLVRDEDIYRDLIQEAYLNKKNINSIKDLQDYIFYAYMKIISRKQNDSDQKDIDDILDILSITANGYMRLSDKQLIKQKKRESKIKYKSFDETENMFEDLLEAEKGLKIILNEDELLAFREMSTKIKVRNSSD